MNPVFKAKVDEAKALIAAGQMTQEYWDTLSWEQRQAARDMSDCNPALVPFIGRKVRVQEPYEFMTGHTAKTFRVGITTGWRPALMAMRSRTQHGSSDLIRKDQRFTVETSWDA
jgi:hypothetical protein